MVLTCKDWAAENADTFRHHCNEADLRLPGDDHRRYSRLHADEPAGTSQGMKGL